MERTYKPEGGRFTSAENKEYLATPQGLERAMNAGVILEGVVTLCDSRLCLHVDLPCAVGVAVAGMLPFAFYDQMKSLL